MCGIVGIVGLSAQPQQIERMLDTLLSRGPDDSGVWNEDNVALGHRRLSIVDLSAAGHQPMVSNNGEWVLTYNGEIYNADMLRSELSAPWRGHSDTEVLVEAIAQWGVQAATEKLIGMFAFAAYHRPSKALYLVRDRLGIKPLYYGWAGKDLVFGSEVRAFKPWQQDLAINRDALASYLRHNYLPAPSSIYQQISKLPPATCLRIDTTQGPSQSPTTTTYWQLADIARQSQLEGDDATLLAELEATLIAAVQSRLVADVPLGAFLSGGFDSSLVCALMQANAERPVRTFTIGFSEPGFNEAEHALKIAQHLGTEHTELYVNESDLLDSVERLPDMLDEPFADSSLLPTYLVCALARQHVTVALSGDGGDELFWGYERYQTSRLLWQRLAKFPRSARQLGAKAASNTLLLKLARHLKAPAWGGRASTLDQKLATAAELTGAADEQDLYRALISHQRQPNNLVIEGHECPTVYSARDHWTSNLDSEERMAWQDTLAYLPDDILTKVDRASMAVSLEARVPLLDHRVVELAARLPAHLKRQGTTTKWALRQILARYVPPELTERKKMGFGVPLDSWLRGPLRSWATDLLSPERLHSEGIFETNKVTHLLEAHMADRANHGARLWDLLMVQLWLDTQSR